jgi:hypothetical protein
VIRGKHLHGCGKLKAELLAVENQSAGVPPVVQKLVEIFYDKPLEPKNKIYQALWLAGNDR